MKRFANILLVLHEQCDRQSALDWAASVAQENQAALHVLEVIEALPRDVRAGLDLARPIVQGDPERTALRKCTSRLREYVAPIRGLDIPGETKAAIGVEPQAIADEARRLGCDLVILVAERPHGLKQRLFGGTATAGLFGGSTADKLLRRLDCSMLILHAEEVVQDGREDGLGRQLYRRPGDGSTTATPTIATATQHQALPPQPPGER
jgi:nucleotide-binding universal stress UspA family protein